MAHQLQEDQDATSSHLKIHQVAIIFYSMHITVYSYFYSSTNSE